MSSCPTLLELEHFVSVAQQPADTELAAHVRSCVPCQRRVDELAAGNLLLQKVGQALELADHQPPQPSVNVQTGTCLGGYQLTQLLHTGGQAAVFKAHRLDGTSETPVAVKIWNRRLDESVEHRLRFERELETTQQLEHPHIVNAIAGGIEDGVGFFVMDLIQGSPIDDFADARRVRPDVGPRGLCQLMIDVSDAVAYAHGRGIIHRDLKPANILVSANGAPRVLDFGLAKSMAASHTDAPVGLTATGQFLGTLAFASPEQLTGDPSDVDAQSDVYALGVIAYRALTGRMPYATAGPPAEVLANIQSAEIALPSRWNPELDRDLDAIVMQALQRDKRMRYRTVSHLQSDLQNYLTGDLIDARRHSQWHLLARVVRRHAWAATTVLAIVSCLVLAAIFGGVALLQTRRSLALSKQSATQQRQLATAAQQATSEAERQAYRASITAATLAGDPRSMRDWLDSSPEDQRHWEWYYLRQLADQTETLLLGHERFVECVRPVGANRLISTSWDGTARLWDLERQEQLSSTQLHKHVWGLAISPDKRIAAVGDFDGRVHILRSDTLESERVIDGLEHPVFGLAFDAKGEQLAVFHSQSLQSLVPPGASQVAIYDTDQWQSLGVHELETSARSISPLGQDTWLFSGLQQSGVLHTQDGLKRQLPGSTSAVPGPRGKRIFLAQTHGDLLALPADGDRSSPLWSLPAGVVNEICVSADGHRLAIAGRLASLRVLDAANGQLLTERVGHDWAISSATFVNNRYLATGGRDHSVRVWDLAPESSHVSQWHGHSDSVQAMLALPELLLTGSQDRTLRCWDVHSGQLLDKISLPGGIWSIDYQASSGRLLAGIEGGRLWLGSLDTGAGQIETVDQFTVASDGGTVHDARFYGEDHALICTSSNLLAQVQLSNGRLLHTNRAHRGHIHRIQLIDQELAVSADHDRILIWGTDEFRQTVELRRSIYQDDYSLEVVGDLIVAGRNPGQIGMWNLHTGALEHVLNGHGDEVLDLAIHPDRTRMVSCSADRTTKLWDLTQRQPLTVIKTGNTVLNRVEFGPVGHRLYGGARDGRILVWDCAPTGQTGELRDAER